MNTYWSQYVQKTEELKLQCDFVAGDATKLSFQNNTFDVCYSVRFVK